MSVKKGMWKTKSGEVIRIADMDADHLRNSLCLYYRKIQDLGSPPTNGNPDVNKSTREYYESRFVELGEEGQKRQWFPPNMPYEDFLATVAEWNREAQERRRRYADRMSTRTTADTNRPPFVAVLNPIPATSTLVSSSVNVIAEVVSLISQELPKPELLCIDMERKISFEL